jgi:hypothetical protein
MNTKHILIVAALAAVIQTGAYAQTTAPAPDTNAAAAAPVHVNKALIPVKHHRRIRNRHSSSSAPRPRPATMTSSSSATPSRRVGKATGKNVWQELGAKSQDHQHGRQR